MGTLRSHPRLFGAAGALLVVALVVVLAVTSGSSGSGAGNATDAAFVADMVPHHDGAIAMAKLAKRRAEHPQVRELAANIISAQEGEIGAMRAIGHDLQDMGSGGSDHMNMGSGDMPMGSGHMGLSDSAMGMEMDMPALKMAKPFDRAFIDMMIPHHQGAIRMARQELAKGRQPALRKMAEGIVAAQSREIAQMRAWRKAWYGATTT